MMQVTAGFKTPTFIFVFGGSIKMPQCFQLHIL